MVGCLMWGWYCCSSFLTTVSSSDSRWWCSSHLLQKAQKSSLRNICWEYLLSEVCQYLKNSILSVSSLRSSDHSFYSTTVAPGVFFSQTILRVRACVLWWLTLRLFVWQVVALSTQTQIMKLGERHGSVHELKQMFAQKVKLYNKLRVFLSKQLLYGIRL